MALPSVSLGSLAASAAKPQDMWPMAHTPAVKMAASIGGANDEKTIATDVTTETSSTLSASAPTRCTGSTPPFHHTRQR